MAGGVIEGLSLVSGLSLGFVSSTLLFSVSWATSLVLSKLKYYDPEESRASQIFPTGVEKGRMCFEATTDGKASPLDSSSRCWLGFLCNYKEIATTTNGNVEVSRDATTENMSLILSIFSPEIREEVATTIKQFTQNVVPFDTLFQRISREQLRVIGKYEGGKALLFFEESPDFMLEHHKIQNSLNKSIEQIKYFECIINKIDMPIWSRGSNLNIDYVNSAYVHASGSASLSAVLRQQRELTLRTENSPDAIRLAEKSIRIKEECNENRTIIFDGKKKTLKVTEIPKDNSSGSVGYAIDYTDYLSLQRQISEIKSAYLTIFNNIHIGVASFGVNQRLRFFNDAITRIWNLDESWLNSCPTHWEVLDELRKSQRLPGTEDYASWKDYILGLHNGHSSFKEEEWHLSGGESYKVMVLPDHSGGIVFLFEDVSDHLRLERKHSQTVAIRNTALNSLEEGILLLGPDGCSKLCNPSFVRILMGEGEPAEYLGKHTRFLDEKCSSLSGDGKFLSDIFADLSGTSNRKTKNITITLNDSRILDVKAIPSPGGTILLTFTDITDRKKLEYALKERGELLEASNKMKKAFLGRVTYSLRTPLNTIVGFSEILRAQMFGKLNSQQSEYVMGILEASKDLLQLLEDAFTLISLESGTVEMKKESLRPEKLIDDLSVLLRSQLNNRNQKVSCRIVGDPPPEIYCDREKVTQTLFILLTEAIENAPSDAVVDLVMSQNHSNGGAELYITNYVHDRSYEEALVRVFTKNSTDKYSPYDSVYEKDRRTLRLTLAKRTIEINGGEVYLQEDVESAGVLTIVNFPSS